MNESDYYKKYYKMQVTEKNNCLTVSKLDQSNWININLDIINNDNRAIEIDIRSRAMAEQLHFMLGQLLGD